MTTNILRNANRLIHETSPYLLQHAYNPVNWYPWGSEALEKAKRENKLMLISIGYSACHWCHVMERESFEDEEVAKLMNDLFVCIKVDREERPDIDQVYMNAVQLMTGHGGWPLNCFTLPGGKPVYGGTYFQQQQWKKVLIHLADGFKTEPDKFYEYAEQLTTAVRTNELVPGIHTPEEFSAEPLKQMYQAWKPRFDTTEGGPLKAPKFALPNNYQFLLQLCYSSVLTTGEQEELKTHIKLTLQKMAWGGLYDQAGGGFARYSTDTGWKVPHFEKMLYDNAQLVSLYTEAYQAMKDPLYKQVVYETLAFVSRELTDKTGAFYSALDADSEGQEGKYYVWTLSELKKIIGTTFAVFSDYYNVNEAGYWEHDHYILLRKEEDEVIAKRHGISVEVLNEQVNDWKKKLLVRRELRVRPGLDDKSLTSWNALMLKAYADAGKVFDEPGFINAALKNATFIVSKQLRADGELFHSYKNGRSTINGYLEDYCFTIEGFIALYEATMDTQWIEKARQLADYVLLHFYDDKTGMYWFTSDLDEPLIARKMEVMDNVIPASNSSLAKSLFLLSHYLNEERYTKLYRKMLGNVISSMPSYGSGYSNWGILLLFETQPFYEIAIVGNLVNEKYRELAQDYIPNKIFAGAKERDTTDLLPLLQNRYVEHQTLIYVCRNHTCLQPVEEWQEARRQLV